MAAVDQDRGDVLDVLDTMIAREEAALVARTQRSHELHRRRPVPPRRSRLVVAGRPAVPGLHRAGIRLARLGRRRQGIRRPSAGFGTMLAGHAHPAIVGAATECVRRGTHFAQPVPDIIPVAAELARRFGLPMWRLTNSGTATTMAAIHLMRAVTGRTHVIKVEGSYHGHHDTVQVSVHPAPDAFGAPDQPATVREHGAVPPEVAALVHVVPFGRLDAVRRVLLAHPGQIAGMIVEPVMMNIGVVPPPPGDLDGLATLLHTHGALLTFDEVKTGLSIAPGGATERFGVVSTSSAWPRRSAAGCRAGRSAARPR